ETMTVNGTIHRTGILLLCALATALWTWSQFFKTGDAADVAPYMWLGVIGGVGMALGTGFQKEWAPVTAPIYALLEGFVLGGVSATIESIPRFQGIAVEAVALTFGTLFCMLLAYRSGLIRATEKFKVGVFAATGAIALFYLVTMV